MNALTLSLALAVLAVDPEVADTSDAGAEVAAPLGGTDGQPPMPAEAPDAGVSPGVLINPTTGQRMGKIVGGWEYVWAAYGLTWAGMLLFVVSLWARRSKAP